MWRWSYGGTMKLFAIRGIYGTKLRMMWFQIGWSIGGGCLSGGFMSYLCGNKLLFTPWSWFCDGLKNEVITSGLNFLRAVQDQFCQKISLIFYIFGPIKWFAQFLDCFLKKKLNMDLNGTAEFLIGSKYWFFNLWTGWDLFYKKKFYFFAKLVLISGLFLFRIFYQSGI